MTTAQESPNGHRVSPPPFSVENPAELDSADLPANQDNNNHFAASSYHVPPELYAPKADSFHDTIPDGLSAMKMPDRCQFMFSDGRQCTMARSDIHPSLCFYHADREEQLFGDPSHRCETRKLDFPELFSASRDLSTAAGVNRALAQVFRLLAQRRISRQEAATFAKLAQLLLQSIRAASQEQPMTEVVEREKAPGITALFAQKELKRGIPPDSLTYERGERNAQPASRTGLRENSPLPANEIPPFSQHRNGDASSPSAPLSMNPPSERITPAAPPAPSPTRTVIDNSSEMNTSATIACNSREINTYKNVELKTLQNEHLHTNERRSLCNSGRPDAFGLET